MLRSLPLLVAALLTVPGTAVAAPVRLERVVLLPSPDRASIVFELTAPPQHVSTRRISDSVIELEAGPGIETAAPRLLKAPTTVRFVDSVTVRVVATPEGLMVRARIALSAQAHAVVRSSGRRVYLDIAGVPAPGPSRAASTPATGSVVAAAPAPSVTPVSAEEAFQRAVRPSLDKLTELVPFLSSAAGSGDPTVAAAILPALTDVRGALGSLQPPEAVRGSHAMVLNAVDRIARALSTDFGGDRAATVKQSATTIQVVGAVLRGE